LRSVHIYAIDSISSVYKNHSFINPLFHKQKLKNLSDFSKANIELIKLINSYESNNIDELEFENIALSIANKTFHEYDLFIAQKIKALILITTLNLYYMNFQKLIFQD